MLRKGSYIGDVLNSKNSRSRKKKLATITEQFDFKHKDSKLLKIALKNQKKICVKAIVALEKKQKYH